MTVNSSPRRRLFAALVVMFALQACGGNKPMPRAEREVLVLGALGPPEPARRGIEMALDEYNASNDSTYQVRLQSIAIDPKNPASATEAATTMAAVQRLVGVLAPVDDARLANVLPILDEAGIPLLTTSISSELVAGESKGFRRLLANDRQEGSLLLGRTGGPVMIFHDGGSAGRVFGEGARQAADEAKRPVLRFDRIGPATNLGALAGPIAAAPPQSLLYGGEGELGKRLAAALVAAGYKGQMALSHQALGVKAEGIADKVISGSSAAVTGDPALSSFAKNYRSRFSAAPARLSVEAYEGALMFLEAIEEVEPKPRVVAEFLNLNRSFLGDSKTYEFDPAGELVAPVVWVSETKAGQWSWVGRAGQGASRR